MYNNLQIQNLVVNVVWLLQGKGQKLVKKTAKKKC